MTIKDSQRQSEYSLQTALPHLDLPEPCSRSRGAARKSPFQLAHRFKRLQAGLLVAKEHPQSKGAEGSTHWLKIPQLPNTTLEPCRTTTSIMQCAIITSTNPSKNSSPRRPQSPCQSAKQAAAHVVSHARSSSRPTGTRRHGRSRRANYPN